MLALYASHMLHEVRFGPTSCSASSASYSPRAKRPSPSLSAMLAAEIRACGSLSGAYRRLKVAMPLHDFKAFKRL